MRHLKPYLESNLYHNDEITESDYIEMRGDFKKRKPFTKSEIGKIEDFISKWEKKRESFFLYFAHHSPGGLFKKSKYGLNILNYQNYPLGLQVVKDDDDWFYIAIENHTSRMYQSEMKYYKCDSIDGLIKKINEIFIPLFISQSEKDLRKVISNKIKNLPSDKLSKLEKILDTL
jgi:hypothetical protein